MDPTKFAHAFLGHLLTRFMKTNSKILSEPFIILSATSKSSFKVGVNFYRKCALEALDDVTNWLKGDLSTGDRVAVS